MAFMVGAADLWMCAGLLRQVPALAWLGLGVLALGALIYWALDCYFLEALLIRFPITVEIGTESPVSKLVATKCTSFQRREVYQVADGGSVGLDWSGTEQPTTPTVAIIPGLTSDSSNAYLKYLVAAVTARGWRSVIINHRGLGGVSLTSETFYNAGWTSDMREVLYEIKARLPAAPLALVGTSLGANMVIKFLAEEGDDCPIWGAVAMGCPYDLLVCDRFMNRTYVQRLWNSALARGLKEFAELHKEPFSKFVDFQNLQRSRTLREFDDRITRFTSNFETVDTYYRRCSSAPYMTTVRTPLLAMSTLDDPICTKESIPWDECRLNPYVTLATAPRGGHLAIYDGWIPRRLWWTKPCADFLGGIFDVGYKGLEPVQAANGALPGGGLPLVRGVGEEVATEAGDACNGVTEALPREVRVKVTPKVGARPNGVLPGMNGVMHVPDLGSPKLAGKANGLFLHEAPEMNGHDHPTAAALWGDASEISSKAPDHPSKASANPSKGSESPVKVSATSTPVGTGRSTRIVVEFTDQAQAAAVEAFLSGILEQMQGVAVPSRTTHQSLSDAAIAASSAAASASAVAAAAAAVVRSASAAVRNLDTVSLEVNGRGKADKRVVIDGTRYSELMRVYNRLAMHGSKSTWLLAYVAVAVSFPLVGALMRMQAVRGVKRSEQMLKLSQRVGLK